MKVVEGICELSKSLADHVEVLSVIIRKMGQETWEECTETACHSQKYLFIDALNVKS